MAEQQSSKWDFFIAHAGKDLKIARKLYEKLKQHARVFLDDECLDPGDSWDVKLPEAQNESQITIVLISKNTDTAYYEREEIAAAIDMTRNTDRCHRLVPVYLDDPEEIDVPYGLRRRQNLVLNELGIDGVVDKLRDLLPSVLRQPPKDKPTTGRNRRRFLTDYRILLAVVLLGAIGMFSFRGYIFGSSKQCITIEHLSPNKIPHYLLKSVGSKNFPYWLKIFAKNNCGEPKILTIGFESSETVSLDPTSKRIHLDVNEEDSVIVKPMFNLPSQTTSPVIISWTAKDEVDKIIDADDIDSDIIRPYTVFWGLQKPVKPDVWMPVEESYILASLSAWMWPTLDTSVPVTKACWRSGIDFSGAVESCYNFLFQGDSQMTIRKALFHFPSQTEQLRISPGKEIVGKDAVAATPLEAALFFVAVMSDASRFKSGIDPLLILFIAPPSDNQALKTAYVAWQRNNKEWKAINFRHANSKRFQENVKDASSRINAICKTVSAINDTLQSKQGAGFVEQKKYAVVDYAKANFAHNIRGLP